MRKLLFASLLLCPTIVNAETFAHEDENWPPPPGPWSTSAVVSVNLAQSAFSDNWSGGDRGAISWLAKGDVRARRQTADWFHWANQLQLSYGQTSRQVEDPDGSGDIIWSEPEKSTDQILAESVGIFTNGWAVDPYASVRLDSQFLDASDAKRTRFFNPVTLLESIGVARRFARAEEKETFWRVGFGLRQNISRSFVDAISDDTETEISNQGGLEISNDTIWRLAEDRVLYTGKLLIYFPFFYDKSSDLEDFDAAALAFDANREEVGDFWKSPNIDFQNTFSSELTSWLAVNLYLRLVYEKYDASTAVNLDKPIEELIPVVDAGIRKGGQFQQTLGIGMTFALL